MISVKYLHQVQSLLLSGFMSFIMSGAVKEIMTLEKHDDYQLAGKTGSFFFG